MYTWAKALTLWGLLPFAVFADGTGPVSLLSAEGPVTGQLKGGETHRFRLILAAGDFTRVTLEQHGINVVSRLYGPGGGLLIEVDSLAGTWGPESLSVVAGTNAIHTLEVSSRDLRTAAGEYVLTMISPRPATASDRRRIVIERRMAEGFRHYMSDTEEGLRAAVTAYEEARRGWQEIGDDAGRSEASFMLGACYRRLERNAEALAVLERSLELGPGNGRAKARLLNEIGLVHYGRGDVAAALESYEHAQELWRAAGDAGGQGRAINNIGLLHHRAGRLGEARDAYQRAVELLRHAGEKSVEAVARNNLAAIHRRFDEPEEAFAEYRQLLGYYRARGDVAGESLTLNNLGSLHQHVGEVHEALTRYRASRKLFHQLGNRSREAAALHNLGGLYHYLGESRRGLELLLRAFDLWQQVERADWQAATLTRIADIYTARGDFSAAHAVLLRALALRLAAGRRDGEAATRARLGAVYGQLRDSARALEQLGTALELRRELEDRRGEAAVFLRTGEVHRVTGELDEARAALVRGLDLSRAVGWGHGAANAHRALAILELSSGRPTLARKHLEAAIAEIESSRARVLDLDLRATFFELQRPIYELYVDVLMRLAREQNDAAATPLAFEASERARARTLIDLLAEAGQSVERRVDPRLAAERRRLARRLNAKAASELRSRPDSEDKQRRRSEIAGLVDELRHVEAEIRRRDPGYISLIRPPKVDYRDVQRHVLDEETMLLEFFLGDEKSFLWMLTPKSITGFTLPPKAEIEALGRRAYEGLSVFEPTRRETLCGVLDALGEMLLGPAKEELGDRRLVIVPDGVLHYLPFAAFGDPRGADGRPCTRPPLLERHEIVTLPSAAVMPELRSRLAKQPPAPRAVAVLADPVFSSTDPRVPSGNRGRASALDVGDTETPWPAWDDGRRDLERLPWSRHEAKAIADLVPAAQLFQALGFAASRAAADQLGDYRVVHFATHGVLDSRHPELSAVVLSLVDREGQRQDGFLRLHDIYNLELGADLVVLSGCRTALGRDIRGEGLVGLTRGFFYAGASRVMASLWRVDDHATAELMSRLYRGLLGEGATPAAALRRAQLSLRRESRWHDPYYWAAFTLQGEWQDTSQRSVKANESEVR